MATKIKAVESIIEWDAEMGRMAILNAGDTAEVGDTLAAAKIEAGVAEEVKAKKKGKASEPVEPAPEPAPEDAPPADDSTPPADDSAPV